MRKLILRSLLLLLLIYVPCAHAQDRTEFKMPCSDVLKLGLDKFVNAYGEKTQDYSTYGQKQAFSYYVDCRRPDNDKRALLLSATRRQQVDAVRNELGKVGNSSWSIAYLAAGGGTMYGLASVGAYAVREDFITTLIAALVNSERSQPAARRRAQAAVARSRRELLGFSGIPKLEAWEKESRAEQVKHYRSNVKEIRDGVAQLESIIRVLPDRAAELVARRMERELSTGFEE